MSRSSYQLCLLLIILTHLLVLSLLIFFPYPELFIYPYLTNHGLLPYHQIFDQHFPGLMFLPLNLNNLGMINETIARLWLAGIVAITQFLLFIISKNIFNSPGKALLVNILYLVWQPFFEGFVFWIDSFMPLILLPAFYFTYRGQAFWAGLLLGLGLLFKQVTGPLVLASLILLWFYRPNKNTLIRFLLGLSPLPLATTFYFWSLGIIQDLWYWTVVFNLTTFAEFGRKAPFFTGVVRLVGVYGLSTLLPSIEDKKLALCLAVYIFGGLIFAFARFDFVHLQPSLPFVTIATVAVFSAIVNTGWGKLVVLGYLAMVIFWLGVFYRGHLGDKVWFFDRETKLVSQKIQSYSDPQEQIFLFGPVLHLYQMSDTLPVGRIFAFQFPWFMMETEELFLQALRDSPPRLIVRDRSVLIEGQKITEFAGKLDLYIEENYEVFETIGVNEFMRPRQKL